MQLTPPPSLAQACAGTLTWLPHPLIGQGRQVMPAMVIQGETLLAYGRRVGLPLHGRLQVTVNGEVLVEWRSYVPRQGDQILIRRAVAGGGGGSNVMRLIMMIVIVIASIYFPPLMGLEAGSMGAAAASAAITIGGTMLMNAILPPPKPVSPSKYGSNASPTYSLSGAQNQVRRYEPLPLVVGQHRIAPDQANQPYVVFDGEDQYLYQAFCFGLQPDLKVTDLCLGETPLADFEGIELTWSDSAGNLPAQFGEVTTIQGADLIGGGDWVQRTTAINCRRIELDLVGAAYTAKDNGDIDTDTIYLEVAYRKSGSANWLPMPDATAIKGNGVNARRVTLGTDVAPEQYDVRVRKITKDPAEDDTKHRNQLSWSTLKCYQTGSATHGGQLRLGIRAKANGQLSGAINELKGIATARCPIWDGHVWATGETRNPAWWYLWFARGARDVQGRRMFGAGLIDNKIDIETIKVWGQWCDLHGYQVSVVLDKGRSVGEVLNLIASCGRGGLTWQSGKLGAVWDAADQPSVAVFSPSNIKSGTFSINYTTESVADEVVGTFANKDKGYQADQVRVMAPGVIFPRQTATVDLEGCTDVALAGRSVNLMVANNLYHKRTICWETDEEGFVAQRGDVVTLSHDLAQWGASGRLRDGDRNTLVLDRALDTSGSSGYLAIRFPDGRYYIYRTRPGSDSTDVVQLVSPVPASDAEGPLPVPADGDFPAVDFMWFFSPKGTPGRRVKISGVEPQQDGSIRFTARDDAADYYAAEFGDFSATANDRALRAFDIYGLTAQEHRRSELTGEADVSIQWSSTAAGSVRLRITVNGTLALDTSTSANTMLVQARAGDAIHADVYPLASLGYIPGRMQQLDYVVSPINVQPITGLHLVAPLIQTLALAWDAARYAASYRVEIYGDTPERKLRSADVASPYFTYRLDDLKADGGPWRTLKARVYGLASNGEISAYAEIVASNPAPGVPKIAIYADAIDMAVQLSPPADDDVTGYRVWVGKTPDFVVDDAHLEYDGPSPNVTLRLIQGFPLVVGQKYYVRAAAYDGWGVSGLNLTDSAEVQAEPISATLIRMGMIGPEHLTPELIAELEQIPDLKDAAAALLDRVGKVETLALEIPDLKEAADAAASRINEIEPILLQVPAIQQTLGDTLDKISGIEPVVLQVPALQNNVTALASNVTELAAVAADIPRLWQSVGNIDQIDLPALQERLALTEAAGDAAARAALSLAQRLDKALNDLRREHVISDATIEIDPATGEIRLRAVKALANDVSTQFTSVDLVLSAQAGTIASTVQQMDQQADRLTASESVIQQLADRLSLTVTATYVDAHLADINDALTANKLQVGDLTAAQLRNSIGLDQARTTGRNALVGLANAEQTLTAQADALNAQAQATETLVAQLNDAQAAIASERTSRVSGDEAVTSDLSVMRAQQAQTDASLIAERQARSNADDALASDVTALKARTTGAEAGIASEATARATADTALGQRIDTISATVSDNTAAIAGEQQARATADSALASDVQQLSAAVGIAQGDLANAQTQLGQVLDTQLQALFDIDQTRTLARGTTAGLAIARRDLSATVDTQSAQATEQLRLAAAIDDATAAIGEERTARSTADSAQAKTTTALQAQLDGVANTTAAGLITEQQARADADGALATDISALKARTTGTEAGIASEATARATADTALGQRIDTISATVSDNTAAIAGEQQARATADSALASDVQQLSAAVGIAQDNIADSQAKLGQVLDTQLQALFDIDQTRTLARGTTAGLAIARRDLSVAVDAQSAQATEQLHLAAAIDDATAAIGEERIARTTADSAQAKTTTALQAQLDGVASTTAAGLITEQQARADADGALASDITALKARTGTAEAALASEISARTSADSALGTRIDTIDTTLGSTTASVAAEQQARTDADGALATDISALKARTTTAESGIASEATARVTADTALAQRIDTLSAAFSDNSAAIAGEQQARATADSALAGDVRQLSAAVGIAQGDLANAEAQLGQVLDTQLQALFDIDQTRTLARGTTAGLAIARRDLSATVDTQSAQATEQLRLAAAIDDATAAIGEERTARSTADSAQAKTTTALQAQLDGVASTTAAGLITEQQARADADGALASDITALKARTGTAEAALASETSARTTADSALGARIDTLETTLGSTSASVAAEQQARADADGALATDIAALKSRTTAAEAGIASESATRATVDSALASDVQQLSAVVGDAQGDVATVRSQLMDALDAQLQALWNVDKARTIARTSTANVAIAQRDIVTAVSNLAAEATERLLLAAAVDSAAAALLDERTARTTAELALSKTTTSLQAQVDGAVATSAAGLLTEQQARATADTALASDVTALKARVGNTETSISTETSARTTADTALGVRIDTLTTTVDGANASITAEQQARVAADTAQASDLSALKTRVGAAETSIASETTARSTADTALGTRIDTLTTRVGTAETSITTETTARSSADTALGKRIDQVVASVADASAAVATEASTRATADSANATSIQQVSTSLNGVSSTVSQHTQSINGLLGQWTVSITSGNKVGGIRLATDAGTGSAFDILADRFSVSLPNGTASRQVFVATTRNGMPAVGISGDLLVDGTVAAQALSVQTLSALTANMGTITAGQIRGASGQFGIDANAQGGSWQLWGPGYYITADGQGYFSRGLIGSSIRITSGSGQISSGGTVALVDTGIEFDLNAPSSIMPYHAVAFTRKSTSGYICVTADIAYTPVDTSGRVRVYVAVRPVYSAGTGISFDWYLFRN